jgi:hypothetical protein
MSDKLPINAGKHGLGKTIGRSLSPRAGLIAGVWRAKVIGTQHEANQGVLALRSHRKFSRFARGGQVTTHHALVGFAERMLRNFG